MLCCLTPGTPSNASLRRGVWTSQFHDASECSSATKVLAVSDRLWVRLTSSFNQAAPRAAVSLELSICHFLIGLLALNLPCTNRN